MLTRQDFEARYKIFDKFALADQRSYYTNKTELFRAARGQVNFIRALMGLLTGFATAFAVFLASQAYGGACALPNPDPALNCGLMRGWTGVLAAASITALLISAGGDEDTARRARVSCGPALGGAGVICRGWF